MCGLLGSLASVAGATTCPNEQLRAENGSERLPDCRAYELVSPAEKDGAEAGTIQEEPRYAASTADGDALLYSTSGPFGETTTGLDEYSVARRSPITGWSTSAALPRPQGEISFIKDSPRRFIPSADLSHFLFSANGSFTPEDPDSPENPFGGSESVYIASLEGSIAWVGKPTISNPDPPLGHVEGLPDLAGGSLDLRTVYFAWYGILASGEEARKENVEPRAHVQNAWGFYEWSEDPLASGKGALTPAGVLPNGTLDPFGAVPAATVQEGQGATPEDFDNQVSAGGSRAFFVSPDPHSEHPSTDVPQLYVRENGEKTALVSEDTLLKPIEGRPAPAPSGPVEIEDPNVSNVSSYVYASPDGSEAFFESTDRLTSEAPENELPKEYDFDTDTNTLSYLSEVTAPLIASSEDGSRFVFENTSTPEPELDLATITRSGGREVAHVGIATIAELPKSRFYGKVFVGPGRSTADGTVFVFETDSPIQPLTGAPFNNAGGYFQVYRYDATSTSLTCVSCPTVGVPTGDAHLSNDELSGHLTDSRGMSSDASRIFFDTPDALVPQDINGKRDVYEWEGGSVHLISSGTSPSASLLLDNSALGNDVFFATTDGLVASDTDQGYDVYDARVDGGFPAPAEPSLCMGSCQGPPSPPPLFGTPSSTTFSGEGNVAPPAAKPTKPSGPKAKKKPRTHRPKKRKSKGRKAKKATGRGGR